MEQEEAKKYLKKSVRLVLTNSYRFTGRVINTNPDTIVIDDKFGKLVSIRLSEIVSFEVIE